MNAITRNESYVPRDYTAPQMALIKKTVASDCNDLEFNLFIEICRRQGLDPFRKQIYAIVTNKTKADKRKLVTVTAIDGYRVKAARCRDYRPSDDEPEFTYDDTAKNQQTNPLGLVKAKVKGFKQDNKGGWHQVVGVAFWDEFAPLKETGGKMVETGEVWEDSGKPKKVWKGNDIWVLDKDKTGWIKSPRNQLAKCAEAQMLRKGWPEEFSGLYVTEEMDRTMTAEMSASEIAAEHERTERLIAVNHKQAVPLVIEPGNVEFVPMGKVYDRIEEFLRQQEGELGAVRVRQFKADNVEGLRHFWAEQPTDALAVKKMIEQYSAKLGA